MKTMPNPTRRQRERVVECERCGDEGSYLHTKRGFGGIAVAFEIRRCNCLAALLYGRERLGSYHRDTWYPFVCAGCRDLIVVSGAQINGGKRYCTTSCGESYRWGKEPPNG